MMRRDGEKCENQVREEKVNGGKGRKGEGRK